MSKDFFFFSEVLGFEIRALHLPGQLYHLSHSASLLCIGYFQDRVSRTIFPG
jgi:hypothetical protein